MDDALATRLTTLRAAAPSVQHEANNALMVLTANLEMLARGAQTDAARRQASRALEAAHRLDATLRAYLSLMRQPVGEAASAPPTTTIPAILPLLRAVLGSRTPVEVRMEGGDTPVPHDAAAIQTALLALALGAAGKGEAGAPLSVTLRPTPEGMALEVQQPPGSGTSSSSLPVTENSPKSMVISSATPLAK